MYSNTNDDLYAIPHKENNNNNNPSEGLYDAPCDLEEPAPVIQNKYTIQYTGEDSYCATNESYAVVDRDNRTGNKGNDVGSESHFQRHGDEKFGKNSKGKALSRTIRKLGNILLVVLVIGLATTSYLLYTVQNDLSSRKVRFAVILLKSKWVLMSASSSCICLVAGGMSIACPTPIQCRTVTGLPGGIGS